jgi:1-phosphatidylinositol-4-phosphate 5-kinase
LGTATLLKFSNLSQAAIALSYLIDSSNTPLDSGRLDAMASPSPALSSPVFGSPSNTDRQSLVPNGNHLSSSVSSSKTTPLPGPFSGNIPSKSSSAQTLGRDRAQETVNPIHTLAGTQEVHIVRVAGDRVQLESGPIPDTLLQKVGKQVSSVVHGRPDGTVFPPSPPASLNGHEDGSPSQFSPKPSSSSLAAEEPPHSPISETMSEYTPSSPIFDEPEPMSLRGRQTSVASSSRDVRFADSTGEYQPRTSSETKTSLRSPLRPSRMSEESHATEGAPSESFLKPSINHLSSDGHLLPPPVTTHPHRPTRRNTTGGAGPRLIPPAPQRSGTTKFATGYAYEEGDLEGEQLASDIEAAAEQIRRERLSKRAKQQQEAEAALTRANTSKNGKEDGNGVLVGNLIGEDHVNYVLMYNMLTGIRIGVSRCQAKIKRELKDEDFRGAHKYSFDIVGNEVTPSAKYDFKFKDYASWVFRELREDYFQLDPADYLVSLTSKYILSELGSPGKSGSFFYFSRDYRFIIKTIRHSEAKFLLSILKDYHAHVKNNPHTLLSRFYGLHRVKLPRGRKIHFVIMNNLFPPHRDIHETYDLKGSTIGREYPEDKARENPNAVLKDLNWINRGKMLEMGPEKRAFLTEQIRRDTEFLKKIGVMDYSLLVGIHNMERGNRDNVRKNTLKVFSPAITMRRRATQPNKAVSSHDAAALRRVMRESDPNRLLKKSAIKLPETDTGDRQQFIFHQDEGGMRATDELNDPQADPGMIYYLGIIDILTPYNGMKKLEHLWKGAQHDRHKISPVPPDEYGDRFFSFMKAIMRGGEGGGRFKAS